MIAASGHAHQAYTFWRFLGDWWWVLLLFGGAILEWIGGVLSAIYEALAGLGTARHRRRIELLKAQAKLEKARYTPSIQLAKPGPCVHRNVVPVISSDGINGSVTSWLCKTCDTQLPHDWAIRQEDL